MQTTFLSKLAMACRTSDPYAVGRGFKPFPDN